jgi:transposase
MGMKSLLLANQLHCWLVRIFRNTSGATDMSIVRVSVGLDYHDDSIRVCILNEEGDTLVNRDVPNDPGAVRNVVAGFGYPGGVALEACCGAANFATKLKELTGWKVHLAHTGHVRNFKKGPDKTDHGDAWLLADLVRVKYLPEVWLADEFTRQLRRLVHHRQALVADRKNAKLRIRGLLREERVECPATARPWSKAWMQWLAEVELGPQSRWVLDEQLETLCYAQKKIVAAEEQMKLAIADDQTTKKLLEQDGIGLVTAVTLRAEIGTFDRFTTGKQLSKYCGVTPCNASSGKREADAGLIRTGNKALRAIIIQTAQRLPRHVDRWRELKQRLTKTKPASVATAAVANRWLRWLFQQMRTPQAVAMAA